ncbi:mo25 protein [Coniophora puteana RWD-64-598 SS2]|uniref:Mo25 protein n=1 Tax=Coniophora puteana (strain RWD-64-598) TaxID=741705 RepID=A0A5M3M953_CONPW|nr:mo25 protein [Coniophora puteana RWD-64-598 SS2]EIW75607.1 mo25 protein [Coniophora puteana RWD-64-598 SS2]
MNFFKTKQRTPSDLVRGLRDAIPKLESGAPGSETRRKANDEVSKNLQQIKGILYGDGDPLPELVAQLATETYATDLLLLLVQHIARFDFEARKDVVQIFNNLLRRQIGARWPTVEYICAKHEDIVFGALAGYANEEIALNTGMVLREMLRHEQLAKILLYSEQFYMFPHYIETTTFGVSCDAFANLKETLTRHKPMVAEYLDKNYDRFFNSFTTLILSTNYVTKRQSLKLLGEILLDRANFSVMTRYIASEGNLKMMMNMLRDKSKNIQFEAFHVFKVFVANPKKPDQIEAILRRNKEKLLVFLKNFHNDKEDEQFSDEKQFLIVQIQNL